MTHAAGALVKQCNRLTTLAGGVRIAKSSSPEEWGSSFRATWQALIKHDTGHVAHLCQLVGRSRWQVLLAQIKLARSKLAREAQAITAQVVAKKRGAFRERLADKTTGLSQAFKALRVERTPRLSMVKGCEGGVVTDPAEIDRSMLRERGE
eukprot:14526262-Alexandrium_andersonii.AAC.1